MRVTFAPSKSLDEQAPLRSGALRQGEEYTVLEVSAQHGGSMNFRIEYSDKERCALFDSRLFVMTSTVVPPSWRFFLLPGGSFRLRPPAWHEEGFWEAFFDGEQWAQVVYEEERERIANTPKG